MKLVLKAKIEQLAKQYRNFEGDYRRHVIDNEVFEILEAEAKSIDERLSYLRHYELIKYGFKK